MQGSGAVAELGDHDGVWGGSLVVGEELAVVVQEGGVQAGIHCF